MAPAAPCAGTGPLGAVQSRSSAGERQGPRWMVCPGWGERQGPQPAPPSLRGPCPPPARLSARRSSAIYATQKTNAQPQASPSSAGDEAAVPATSAVRMECLRCGGAYTAEENSPGACQYHGHMTGDRGLLALAPPHQGVDGEWSEQSGVIVYVWAREGDRPSTGRSNWRSRWTCCGVYGEDAPPCRRGWHASYSDGATRF